MRPTTERPGGALVAVFLIAAVCVPTASAGELTRDGYEKARAAMGVVLLGASWGRAWGYCGFENVQLRSIAFDRMPVRKEGDEAPADLVLKGPALLAKAASVDYAFLLAPGEYALSAFQIKAAKSLNDVGVFQAGRTKLIPNGKPVAGSFRVSANETVYIGHFAPDCPQPGKPMIWRYYLQDAAAFREYLVKVKEKYTFLDVEAAQFRLFQTKTIGREFELQ